MKKPSIVLMTDVSVAALVEKTLTMMTTPPLSKTYAEAVTREPAKPQMPRSITLMTQIIRDIAGLNFGVPSAHLKIDYNIHDRAHFLDFSYARPDAKVSGVANYTAQNFQEDIAALLDHLEPLPEEDKGLLFDTKNQSLAFTDKSSLLLILGRYLENEKNNLCTPDIIDFPEMEEGELPLVDEMKLEYQDAQVMRERVSHYAQQIKKRINDPKEKGLDRDFILKIMPVRSYLSIAHYMAVAETSYDVEIQISLDHVAKTIEHEDKIKLSRSQILCFNQGGYN